MYNVKNAVCRAASLQTNGKLGASVQPPRTGSARGKRPQQDDIAQAAIYSLNAWPSITKVFDRPFQLMQKWLRSTTKVTFKKGNKDICH
jgi:hypothetical protein